MTEDQLQGVQALLSGTDVVAAMPTGSGKSLIFQCITCLDAAVTFDV